MANYIASAEKIPFNDAVSKIEKEIQEWNQKIENESIEITKIGSLSLNKDKKIIFEPATSVNYLTSSFGLNSFNSPAIKRLQYKEKAARLEPIVLELDSDEKRNRKAPLFLKYAATAAIIFAVGSFGWKTYNENQYQNQLLAEQVLQESVERKIQQATFVIENPLPAITLNLVKEVQNYHVIAGAFREPGNAQKKVNQLLKKGYDAQILGVNKWNLTQVSYGSFSDRLDALQNLRTIKRTVASDAWLLVKEF